MTVAVPAALPSKTTPLLTNSPPATTALLPGTSIAAVGLAAVCGVPRNVRLPPLNASGDDPALTSRVGALGDGPGTSVSSPYVWKSAALTWLPAPTVIDALPPL